MTEPTAVISINGLSKSYGDVVALHPLTLDIPLGEVFGLLGDNRAGKTTLIRLLTTQLVPSSGTARIAGYDIAADPLKVRSAIGYLPENARLYDHLTALENLIFFAGGLEGKHPKETASAALYFLDIAHLADCRAGELSRGMRQRVRLAQAIRHNPHVLFLDEPTSGLDPTELRQLRETIEMLHATGMTIFMTAHHSSEITRSCTSVGVLVQGRLVFHDTAGTKLPDFIAYRRH